MFTIWCLSFDLYSADWADLQVLTFVGQSFHFRCDTIADSVLETIIYYSDVSSGQVERAKDSVVGNNEEWKQSVGQTRTEKENRYWKEEIDIRKGN